MKSKMPCEPGPAPLMKLAQATGLCGGMLVPRLLNPPAARACARLGSRPGFIMLADSRGSMPSMPMTITFLPRLRETRLQLPSQYDRRAPTRAAAAAAPTADAFEKRPAVDFPRCDFGHHASLRRGVQLDLPPHCRLRGIANRQRLAVHVVGHRDAEQVQHRRADVQQSRLFASSIGRLQNSTPGTTDGSTQ